MSLLVASAVWKRSMSDGGDKNNEGPRGSSSMDLRRRTRAYYEDRFTLGASCTGRSMYRNHNPDEGKGRADYIFRDGKERVRREKFVVEGIVQ